MNPAWDPGAGKARSIRGRLVRHLASAVLGLILPIWGWAQAPDDPSRWARQHPLVAHANGAASGFKGTNSREAFLESYARGHRVFEMDLNLSSDHKLVGVHDWSAATLAGLGMKLPPGRPLPLSYAAFKRQKIHGRLTPLGLPDVLQLLREHPDAVLITDTKATDGPEVALAFSALVRACRSRDERLLDRIVPQIYNQAMLETVRSVYPFKSIIYTLYASQDRDPQVVEFVRKSGIKVVTMPAWRAQPEFLKALGACGVLVYVHTINNRERMEALRRIGVHGVYTDLLAP